MSRTHLKALERACRGKVERFTKEVEANGLKYAIDWHGRSAALAEEMLKHTAWAYNLPASEAVCALDLRITNRARRGVVLSAEEARELAAWAEVRHACWQDAGMPDLGAAFAASQALVEVYAAAEDYTDWQYISDVHATALAAMGPTAGGRYKHSRINAPVAVLNQILAAVDAHLNDVAPGAQRSAAELGDAIVEIVVEARR